MKYFCIFIQYSLLLSPFITFGQNKFDYNWTLGYTPNDSAGFIGGTKIDFSHGDPLISYFNLPTNVRLLVPCSMSDENGSLQFYSGGCRISNHQNQLMDNGDDINEGIYHNTYCPSTSDGYLNHHGLLSLPAPGLPGCYYMFHIRKLDTDSDANDLLYTLIDMNENDGLGKVVSKNQPMGWTDTVAFTLNAVKHGNGRDWWIVAINRYKAKYYRILLDPTGVHGPFQQTLENAWIEGHYVVAECEFSPDGTKYAQHTGDVPGAFVLLDFDRCTGEMSNPRKIYIPEDTILYPSWFCFSPNSRFLYVTNSGTTLYQFDTEASDIESSKQIVGTYDGFKSIYQLPTTFYHMLLGPDQRIYMASGNGVNLLHTINKPDEPGLASDFRQHNVRLPSHNAFHLPNYPNFRLYNIEGSLCDTLDIQPPFVAQWRSEQDSVSGPLAVDFTEYSYHLPVSWHWDFGDGSTDTTRQPLHFFPAPGTYTVCLNTCNGLGACDTLCREIEVVSKTVSIPVPSGQLSFSIYPNPAKDIIWVAHEGEQNSTFILKDATGKEIMRSQLPAFSGVEGITVATLPKGLYFWSILDSEKKCASGKLIIL